MDPNSFFQGAVAFIQKYGLLAIICGLIVAAITEAIKIPIYRAGVKYQEKTGIDKSGITWLITLVSLALSFLVAVLVCFFLVHWDYSKLDWAEVSAKSATIYAAATAEYEIVKKIFKAAKAISAANKAKKDSVESSSHDIKNDPSVTIPTVNVEAPKAVEAIAAPKAAKKDEAPKPSEVQGTKSRL